MAELTKAQCDELRRTLETASLWNVLPQGFLERCRGALDTVDALRARLEAAEREMRQLEDHIRCAPNQDDVDALEARVQELEEALRGEQAHADRLAAGLDLVALRSTPDGACWCSIVAGPHHISCVRARALLEEHIARGRSPGKLEGSPEVEEPKPVCSTCGDTHRVAYGEDDGMWPCTWCPTPCRECACDAGRGAYCATTPCSCQCHGKVGILALRGKWPGDETDAEVEAALRDADPRPSSPSSDGASARAEGVTLAESSATGSSSAAEASPSVAEATDPRDALLAEARDVLRLVQRRLDAKERQLAGHRVGRMPEKVFKDLDKTSGTDASVADLLARIDAVLPKKGGG